MSFNDNDRDNIEEKSDIEVIGERREELGDDSDYGGSGDLESQVSIWFSSCHKLSLNQSFSFQDDCRSIQIHPDQVEFDCEKNDRRNSGCTLRQK